MIECFEFSSASNHPADDQVSLDFGMRQKSRGNAMSQYGKKIGWFLERGHVLADGDILMGKNGEAIKVVAADETLSIVESDDSHLLLRAAYHLGNRHVPLQITLTQLRYQHDHVLDDMVRGLGLLVSCQQLPFSPENGAYHHSHMNSHEHNHSKSHSHSDSHSHANVHSHSHSSSHPHDHSHQHD